jgi:hypothetical protein
LSPPPELELELDAVVELDELGALAAALEVEELDDPHAATLATATVNATARPNDRPTRRPGERRLPTSCIRRLLCSSLQDSDRKAWSTICALLFDLITHGASRTSTVAPSEQNDQDRSNQNRFDPVKRQKLRSC